MKAIDIVALGRALSSALGRPLDLASGKLAEAEVLASQLDRGDGGKSIAGSLTSARRSIEDARVVARLLESVGGRSAPAREPHELSAIAADAAAVVEPALEKRGRIELAIHSSHWILADWPRVSHLVMRDPKERSTVPAPRGPLRSRMQQRDENERG